MSLIGISTSLPSGILSRPCSAVGVAASGILVGGVTVTGAWASAGPWGGCQRRVASAGPWDGCQCRVASGCHGGPTGMPVSRLVVGMGAGGPAGLKLAGLKSAGSCDAADVPSLFCLSSAGPTYGPIWAL